MPASGPHTLFDQAFNEALDLARRGGPVDSEALDTLQSWYDNGDWPSLALGERINVLDEILDGAFDRSISQHRRALPAPLPSGTLPHGFFVSPCCSSPRISQRYAVVMWESVDIWTEGGQVYTIAHRDEETPTEAEPLRGQATMALPHRFECDDCHTLFDHPVRAATLSPATSP